MDTRGTAFQLLYQKLRHIAKMRDLEVNTTPFEQRSDRLVYSPSAKFKTSQITPPYLLSFVTKAFQMIPHSNQSTPIVNNILTNTILSTRKCATKLHKR
jgi:hypothetical protein